MEIRPKNLVFDAILLITVLTFALHFSRPLFSYPVGYNTPVYLSKVHFIYEFPWLPKWFPWWYCGKPFLLFEPPLSYLSTAFLGMLLRLPKHFKRSLPGST